MDYAALINNLRNQSGDKRRRIHVDFTGHGSTTVFQMPDDTFPVYDATGSYIVKVGGVLQTEGNDYTIYKNAGTITINTAPTNGQAVTIDCSAVRLTDEDWIEIINSTIKSMGDDFWKEFVDDSNFVTAASMLSLSLVASRPNCIAVYEFQHRHSASENWTPIESYLNWRYDRDNNIIYVGNKDVFTTAGEPFRIRGLETYTLGDSTDDTVDVQDKYHTIVEYGALARFYRWRYKDVVELISKMSKESSRTPLQELIMLSDRFDRLYEQEKARLKPQKPARIIPSYKHGGGRP